MTLDQGEVVEHFEPASKPIARLRHDGVLACHHGLDVDADRPSDHHAIIGRTPGEVSRIGARDKRLRRSASGVDACASEEVPLDQGHGLAGAGDPRGKRGARLPRADDDRVETARHGREPTMRRAATIATASSRNAMGRSRPIAAATRARAAAPPRVPTTAPTTPAASPRTHAPEGTPIAAPQSAPLASRPPNWIGTFRLGVLGSWS